MSRTCKVVLIAAAAVMCHASAAGAALAPCDFGHEPGLCGSVSVPLDRSQPAGQQIDIKFVVFSHTDTSQPAQGTIFVTEGGPGYSVINNNQDGYSQFLFGPLLDRRDLVVIDQRGVGQSGAVDCKRLQAETGDIYAAARECAQDLGAAANVYGSANVAEDVEAVRASLGVEKFDYYGGSFAGADIEAYAARHPDRLRSVVLDSPVWLPAEAPWFALGADQMVKTVTHVCERSPSCSAANHDPAGDLGRLAQKLRKAPFNGTGHDADGKKHRVHMTEARLVDILPSDAGGAIVQGEITAAAHALSHGDRAPLLRLAAENDHPFFFGDGDDPTGFSLGLNVARYCVDQTFQWDKQASLADRQKQYDDALAALSPTTFAPFSVASWTIPAAGGELPRRLHRLAGAERST